MLQLFRFRQQNSNSDSRKTEEQTGRHSNSRARRTDPSSTAAKRTNMGHIAKGEGFKDTQEKEQQMVEIPVT